MKTCFWGDKSFKGKSEKNMYYDGKNWNLSVVELTFWLRFTDGKSCDKIVEKKAFLTLERSKLRV